MLPPVQCAMPLAPSSDKADIVPVGKKRKCIGLVSASQSKAEVDLGLKDNEFIICVIVPQS